MEKKQQWYEVFVTYGDDTTKTGLWAYDIQDARDKAYFKWLHADKREVLLPQ